VGYTALMNTDEKQAAEKRKKHREVFENKHEIFHGEILQYFGDGTLSVFQSGVEAVECAIEIQKDLNQENGIPLRIGLHIGDIVFDGTDIYGDGVNIASRIESIGVAGGILLSGKLNDELENHAHISTLSLGYFSLKNISKPVEVFSVINGGVNVPEKHALRGEEKEEGKSIVVLPFVNMSTDPENEYFSDGMTEEIINALTRVEGLKVIARTSAFAFKNKNIDVRDIGQQLGVSSVLEGSIRKAKNRVRITAQLINAKDGTHFWSENFDRNLDDLFALQDEVSLLIADQIRENFGHFNVQEHLVSTQTKSTEAYELFLKGRFYQLQWDPQSWRQAIECYDLSIQKDPQFARSYYGNLQCYGLMAASGYMPAEEGFAKAAQNFLIARDLDTQSAEYSMSIIGRSLWMDWDFQLAYEQLEEALASHPRHGDSLEAMTELLLANGHFDRAVHYIERAIEVDPLSPNHHYTLANIHYMQRKFEMALVHLKKALSIRRQFPLAIALKAFCLIWLNKREMFNEMVDKVDNPKMLSLLFDVINTDKKDLTEELQFQWSDITEEKNQLLPYKLFILANSEHQTKAVELLGEYIQQKRLQIINFHQEPFLEKLRAHEKFQSFIFPELNLTEKKNASASQAKSTKLNAPDLLVQKAKLLQFLENEKPYLNSQLSLNSLAQSLELSPNQLSLLINETMHVNFNEFINTYRLEIFKKKVFDEKNKHLTLLALAYESGFNSKSVFNAFFKKMEGLSPRAWIKKMTSEQ